MKLPIRVSEDSREPIYHQIETQIKTLIVGGQLPPGTPLPSIRAMASDLQCSVITTRRAYQNLEISGFIKTVQGKGTFVKEMEEVQKKETKERVVLEAFQKAIEHAKHLGFTEEELRSLFDQVLRNHDKE
ncbi:MAG: GntR family transcriptional regulator [Bacillaceae bacterium]|nr:GntR family transcriptional regulator [Bacillaceae bacterium]